MVSVLPYGLHHEIEGLVLKCRWDPANIMATGGLLLPSAGLFLTLSEHLEWP